MIYYKYKKDILRKVMNLNGQENRNKVALCQ